MVVVVVVRSVNEGGGRGQVQESRVVIIRSAKKLPLPVRLL